MVGDPDSIDVDGVVWDDEIEVHFGRHDVSYADVLAVRSSEPMKFRNLEDRGGSHVIVGPGQSGADSVYQHSTHKRCRHLGAGHGLGEPSGSPPLARAAR